MLIKALVTILFGIWWYYIWNHPYFEYHESYRYSPHDTAINFHEIKRVNADINMELNDLTESKFFRLFKIFIDSPCPFYEAQMTCTSHKWIVNEFPLDDIPKDWRQNNTTFSIIATDNLSDKSSRLQQSEAQTEYALSKMKWINAEDFEPEALYYDLANNSEAFTEYNGTLVWSQMYKENLSKVKFSVSSAEEKYLYKLVSGIHANVNMHISHFYSLPDSFDTFENYSMYFERVGSNKDRLENMHFVYQFVLSALSKIKDNSLGYSYSKFNKTENTILKGKMKSFFDKLSKSNFVPINEHNLFKSISVEEFVGEVEAVFHNTTFLIHWVTWSKCKLHGLLQFHGMSAVMKIMFPQEDHEDLTRDEFVGLINLIRKLSNSIKWYNKWIDYESNELYYRSLTFYVVFPLFIFAYILIMVLLVKEPEEVKYSKGFKRA